MSKLTKMIETLEAAGIDTSQFTVVLGDGTKIAPNGNYVEDVQLNNKTFRRWITAQTFRMLYEPSYNTKKHRTEYGWYNYLKNNYDYLYQFKVISDELRILEKLERREEAAFEERKLFFTKEVIVDTCYDCCYKLDQKAHSKKGATISSAYNMASATSLLKAHNVEKRLEELTKNYEKTFVKEE